MGSNNIRVKLIHPKSAWLVRRRSLWSIESQTCSEACNPSRQARRAECSENLQNNLEFYFPNVFNLNTYFAFIFKKYIITYDSLYPRRACAAPGYAFIFKKYIITYDSL